MNGMASADQQARRNQEIVAARAAGRTLAELAKDFGLSLSRIKEVLAEAPTVAAQAVPRTAAMRAVEARRGEYVELAEEVRRFAMALPAEQASAKVGAFRLSMDLLDRLTNLEQAVGYLPRELEEVGDGRALLETTVAVLRDHHVSDEVVQDLAGRLAGEECAA